MSFPSYDSVASYVSVESMKRDIPALGYTGPGWYFTKTDTALVILDGARFSVYVWNYPNADRKIRDALEMRVRLREE